jgi:hypothetical protein
MGSKQICHWSTISISSNNSSLEFKGELKLSFEEEVFEKNFVKIRKKKSLKVEAPLLDLPHAKNIFEMIFPPTPQHYPKDLNMTLHS